MRKNGQMSWRKLTYSVKLGTAVKSHAHRLAGFKKGEFNFYNWFTNHNQQKLIPKKKKKILVLMNDMYFLQYFYEWDQQSPSSSLHTGFI